MATAVVVVTCEGCGQSWHRSTFATDQHFECLFCGEWGRLRVGPMQVDAAGVQRVEARLQPLRAAPS